MVTQIKTCSFIVLSDKEITDITLIDSTVKRLISQGASLEQKNAQEQTPLRYALERQKDKIVNILIKYGAPIEDADLNRAIELQNYKVVRQLLLEGAGQSDKHKKALQTACQASHLASVQLLLEHKTNPNKALHIIIEKIAAIRDANILDTEEYKILSLLLIKGAKPKKKIIKFAEEKKVSETVLNLLKNPSSALLSRPSTPVSTASSSASPRPADSDEDVSPRIVAFSLKPGTL